jgi:hypothetical protein
MTNGFELHPYHWIEFYCPRHVKERKENDVVKNTVPLEDDIVQGREKVPIKFINALDEDLPFEEFTYITMNIDSEDYIANVRSVQDLQSCSCDGLCDDVDECACLMGQ